jgi:DNA-binding transcriptional LysR family regulator
VDLRLLRYFLVVVEERNIGRAAARLLMTQPPLSRAMRHLESDLGLTLLQRSHAGVIPTQAGQALYDEGRALLEHADRARARAVAAGGVPSLTVGTLSDAAEQAGPALAPAFQALHPGVAVRFREADFTDPTCGLRAGAVDVALTWTPFDRSGLTVRVLRRYPVGVLVRADDPLALLASVTTADLAGRSVGQLPDDTDPVWRDYWSGRTFLTGVQGPVVRTFHECIQGILWSNLIGLAPLDHRFPDGLTVVAIDGIPATQLVVAWRRHDPNPLVRAFAGVAATYFHRAGRPADRPGRSGATTG